MRFSLLIFVWIVAVLPLARSIFKLTLCDLLNNQHSLKSETVAGHINDHDCNTTASSQQRGLRDFSLVLVGDSLTRYQYLSLVYFLRWGTWFDPRKRHPHLVQERSYESAFHEENWLEFYWQTTRFFAPWESCDCFRPLVFNLTKICENRYFYDRDRNISVTYIQAYGSNPLHGHFNASTALQTANVDRLTLNLKPYAWEYTTWHDTIRNHIAHLRPKPKWLVANAGYWPNRFMQDASIRQALVDALKDAGIRGIWKTRTASQNRVIKRQDAALDNVMCDVLGGCLNLSWTRTLPKTMWWDKAHFYEPAYRRMNEQMLELIAELESTITA